MADCNGYTVARLIPGPIQYDHLIGTFAGISTYRHIDGECLFCGASNMLEIIPDYSTATGRAVQPFDISSRRYYIDPLPTQMRVFGCASCRVAVYQPR